jgi:ADP-ribose pyrophosphatase YjhB (NUDIX family)
MGYIKEEDYQKLANAAAIDLVDNSVPLNDSISKLASQFEMNQDQLYRLCEASNNVAFNHIFKKNAAASDRIVDFEIADPKKILGDQIKTASVPDFTDNFVPARELRELPNLMDYTRHPDVDSFAVKTASDSSEDVRVRVVGKGGDLQIFSVKKGHWEMPAGTAIKGENKKEAAARILLSNTGLKAAPTQLKYAGLQPFKDKMYHTFEVDVDKLTRVNHAEDAHGVRPKMEFRKEAGFELRPTAKGSLSNDIRTLEKTAEYIRQQKLAAEDTRQDYFAGLVHQFHLLYNPTSFETFEKQAATMWGKAAECHLNHLRSLLRKPAVNYDFDKLAKTAGYVDNIPTEMAQFDTIMLKTAEMEKYDAALTLLNSNITAAYAQLKAS